MWHEDLQLSFAQGGSSAIIIAIIIKEREEEEENIFKTVFKFDTYKIFNF